MFVHETMPDARFGGLLGSPAGGDPPADPQHRLLVRKQLGRIDSLEQELAGVRAERDLLLAENEKLCFQLQMLSECYNGTKRNL